MSTSAETKKPATHYDLLKLKPFEADQAVIRKHFHKLIEQIRAQLAKEPDSAKWRQMAADMTKAMLVLCDARRKADYDLSLGGRADRNARPADLEKIIRARKVLDDAPLEKAKKFADTLNLELHEAIINQKLAPPETIMPLYADSIGLPFVELADLTIDETLIPTLPAMLARQNSLTPVLRDEGAVVVASPRPMKHEIEEQLQLRFGAPVRQVICTKAAIDAALEKHYSREAAAAQMSAVPQAPTKSDASSTPAAGAASRSAVDRAALRQKKRKVGMITGFFAFMISVLIATFMGWTAGSYFPVGVYLAAAAVGGVAATVAFLVVNE